MNEKASILVELQGATLGYGGRVVIAGISLRVSRGDFLGIIGPNGSGKTTLLKCLLGLKRPVAGSVRRAPSVKVGYCMQRQVLDTAVPFTVFEIVMMGRTPDAGPLRRPSARDLAVVQEALKTCGISRLAAASYTALSGGQKQRVLLARALAVGPDLLILDEPTTDLDIKGTREILDLAQDLRRRKNLTVILVSHELDKVVNYAERFVFVNEGKYRVVDDRNSIDAALLADMLGFSVNLERKDGHVILY